MTAKTAKSREKSNTSRKLLAIVDDSPECRIAIYFASCRARNTGGIVTLLYVIPPAELQHWQAVEDVMRDEAREEAERALHEAAAEVLEVSGRMPEMVIREGNTREEIQNLIIEDHDIKVLVLGAAAGKGNPGPLISSIATGGFMEDFGASPIPLAIVPGSLTREEIDALV